MLLKAAPRRDERSLPERLYPPMPSKGWFGWIGPLAVTLIAGLLRLVDLGRPHGFAFDEVYYPKDALSLLRFGYEMQFPPGTDQKILDSNGDWRTLEVFGNSPSFVVHPPFGKWVIASGEYFFGVTPFGWRIAVAILGTLAVLITARTMRRMTRSDLIGTLAGLLLAVDGMHIVMSRTGLLDMVLSFCVLSAFGLIVLDRDRARRRLAKLVETQGLAGVEGSWGPKLGWRPLRFAAGIMLGLACGVKWSGIWYIVAFAVMSVWWDAGARRMVGVSYARTVTFFRSALPSIVPFIIVPIIVYIFTWSGWLFTSGGWGRQWAADQVKQFGQPAGIGRFIPEALRSLWHYHVDAWNFHVTLTGDHSYQSNPISWIFMTRPTSFYWHATKFGEEGCDASSCTQALTALGNPVIWYGGVIAIGYSLYRWIMRRDWRFGAVIVGIGAGVLPWFLYLDRTIFSFYSVVFVPFTCMALAMTLGVLLGPADAPQSRRRWGAVAVGAVVLLAVVLCWWFYPVWSAEQIPYDSWRMRMWMPSWV